jgi:hypothetical protein
LHGEIIIDLGGGVIMVDAASGGNHGGCIALMYCPVRGRLVIHGSDARVELRWFNAITINVETFFSGPVENFVDYRLPRRRLSTGFRFGDTKGLPRAYGGRVLQG